MSINDGQSINKLFDESIKTISFTIPEDFEVESYTQLLVQKINDNPSIYEIPNNLENLIPLETSSQLKPGGKYTATFYPIGHEVTSEDCLDFLKEKKSLMFGPLGLLILFDQCKDELPIGKWLLSFDYPEKLKEGSSNQNMVLSIDHNSDGWGFAFGEFETSWRSPGCLISFNES